MPPGVSKPQMIDESALCYEQIDGGLRNRSSGETSETDLGSCDVTSAFAAGRCFGLQDDRTGVCSIFNPEILLIPLCEKFCLKWLLLPHAVFAELGELGNGNCLQHS